MKKIFKFIVYIILFIFALFVFLPKESLYNLLEQELKKYDVIISDEKREENNFSFEIIDGDLYIKGINLAHIKKAKLTSYLFYTDVELKNIKFLDSLKNMIPSPVTSANLTYSILEFDKINLKANGSFGKVDGVIDLMNRKAIINLDASSKMKSSYTKILNMMSFKNGRYSYEYKF